VSEQFSVSNFATHTDELEYLQQLGFAVNPLNSTANSLDEVWQKNEEVSQKREEMPCLIDGLVVKLNDNELTKKLGIVGKTPRGWCAIKFAAEEATSKITGITWQVGRTGKLTPVAELEEVQLAGTTVKRATLHNAKEVVERDVRIADRVVVRKAGDIIPEVVSILYNLREGGRGNGEQTLPDDFKLLEEKSLPHRCPSCNAELISSETEVDLVCPNTAKCPAQILLRLSYFASRGIADISGLSEKIIQKMMDINGVKDIPDLYNIDWEKMMEQEGFGTKSISNLQQAIEKSRTMDEVTFLAGLGIEGIGKEVAKLIIHAMPEEEVSTEIDSASELLF